MKKNCFEDYNITDDALLGYLRLKHGLNIQAIKRNILPFVLVDCIRFVGGSAIFFYKGITYIFENYVLTTMYYGNAHKKEEFVPMHPTTRSGHKQKKVGISSHATIRYIQRIMKVDLQHIVDDVLLEKFSWSDGRNICNGLTYHVVDGILTHITKNNLKKIKYKPSGYKRF